MYSNKETNLIRIILLLLLACLAGQARGQANLQIQQTARHRGNDNYTTFVVEIRNIGDAPASNVVVSETLHNDWAFTPSVANCSLSHGSLNSATTTQNLIWNIDYIPTGGVAVMTFNAIHSFAQHLGTSPNTFSGTVSWDGGGPVSTGSSNSTVEWGDVNMSVSKTIDNPNPIVGDDVVFTVTLTKINGGNQVNLQITDKLPAGFQYISHSFWDTQSNSSSSLGDYDHTNGIWNLGKTSNNLGINHQFTLAIIAKVLDPDPTNPYHYRNIASLTRVGPETDVTNNIDFVAIDISPSADLAISKIVDNATPQLFDTVTFTIDVVNKGDDEAADVIVADMLPSGYAFVGSTPSVGSYDPVTGLWTLGNLANGASASLQLATTVMPTRDYANTADVSALERDLYPDNNTAEATVTPVFPHADLSISKIISNPTPAIFEEVTFTVKVVNLGGDNTSGVLVTNKLPSGYVYVGNSTTKGTYSHATGLWSIGDLAVSEEVTLTISAQTQASGQYRNTATVAQDGDDPIPGNNTASVKPDFACTDCMHTIPNGGGTLTVANGEVYCLPTGSKFTGTFALAAGGTICVWPGATFNPSSAPSVFNGTIINHGIMEFPTYNPPAHDAIIINHGIFNAPSLQGFAGTIYNYEEIHVSGFSSFLAGAEIINQGEFNLLNSSFTSTTVDNYGTMSINNGLTVNSGYWHNRINGKVYVNMESQSSSVTFNGDIDNSGFWQFARIGSLSSTLNNLGHMQVFNAVNDISQNTYLTNDNLLEFTNVPDVQLNGPMLTNNGTLTINHSTAGNLKLNQAINQLHNNGTVIVTGNIEHNNAGAKIVNNCRIICQNYFVGNGITENNGFIQAFGELEIEGTASELRNSSEGHFRGTDFRNSGKITGYGSYYFTGTTNFASSGIFEDDDPENPIEFYDVTSSGNIFDLFVASNPAINTIRPALMRPIAPSAYGCTAPSTLAGNPPTTQEALFLICGPEVVTFTLGPPWVTPHEDVESESFALLPGTIRLFEYNNPENPTNNTTTLAIPSKGVFTVSSSTGLVTFTPDVAFTGGSVDAEYRISNKRPSDPISYPSRRTRIGITTASINPPPITTESERTSVCISKTLSLANAMGGGIWSSSDEAIASVDEDGLVTAIAVGKATISYTVTVDGCSQSVTQTITVSSCRIISNPMLINRARRPE